MPKPQRAIEIAYLIPDQFWSSTISSMVEVFHGMTLTPKLFQSSEFRGFNTTLLRCTRAKVSGFSGLRFDTEHFASRAGRKRFDVVIVPSVWGLSMDSLERARPALAWLGREATIHWASANLFRQRYPGVKVSPKIQMIESDNIITTSTTPATFDALLLLIQRFLGDRSAEFASHYFTIRDKDAPLPVFLEPSCNDKLVDAARDRIRLSYAQELSLDELARQFNVTSRTLSRRFVSATGLTPMHYLSKQRLEIARRLLQSTDLQIQQVAEQAGFASATVFCRNFKQAFAQTPREYRQALPSSR